MSFQDAIRTCLAKFAAFSGRARRAEFWPFLLFVWLVTFALGIADAALFAPGPHGEPAAVLSGFWQLAMVVPLLAAGWRRMHDTGRSGFYLLYPLLAWIGTMTFLGFGASLSLAAWNSSDALGALVTGTTGLVGLLALVVVAISPLLVLWWLTRPSDPFANVYGPNPREVTP